MKVLTVCDLSFSYGGHEVLSNASFSFSEGKINLVVGGNGVGKSTLMDILSGFYRNEEIKNKISLCNKVSYMTQNFLFPPVLLGKEFAFFFACITRRPEIRKLTFHETRLVADEFLRLQHLWHIRIGNMSGGEKKWLFLVFFSLVDSDVYIFDEPDSGVDAVYRKSILEKIDFLKNQGRICIVASHQFLDFLGYDVDIYFMKNKRIFSLGDYGEWVAKFGQGNPIDAYENYLLST